MLCIIPARSGSKRLPKKNILEFKSKPLLEHVVETALASNIFDDVIVTSESEEVLEIAQRSNATCYKRTNELASDTTPVVDVCLDVLQKHSVESFCCIYPTSVLLKQDTLRKAYRIFNNYSYDKCSVLMGVSSYNYHPVQSLVEESDGTWKMLFEDFKSKRSQDYPVCKVSNGTFYMSRVETFKHEKSFYSDKLRIFDVPDEQVSDIDTVDDYLKLLNAG